MTDRKVQDEDLDLNVKGNSNINKYLTCENAAKWLYIPEQPMLKPSEKMS